MTVGVSIPEVAVDGFDMSHLAAFPTHANWPAKPAATFTEVVAPMKLLPLFDASVAGERPDLRRSAARVMSHRHEDELEEDEEDQEADEGQEDDHDGHHEDDGMDHGEDHGDHDEDEGDAGGGEGDDPGDNGQGDDDEKNELDEDGRKRRRRNKKPRDKDKSKEKEKKQRQMIPLGPEAQSSVRDCLNEIRAVLQLLPSIVKMGAQEELSHFRVRHVQEVLGALEATLVNHRIVTRLPGRPHKNEAAGALHGVKPPEMARKSAQAAQSNVPKEDAALMERIAAALPERWACAACDYVNAYLGNSCAFCGHARGEPFSGEYPAWAKFAYFCKHGEPGVPEEQEESDEEDAFLHPVVVQPLAALPNAPVLLKRPHAVTHTIMPQAVAPAVVAPPKTARIVPPPAAVMMPPAASVPVLQGVPVLISGSPEDKKHKHRHDKKSGSKKHKHKKRRDDE